jgi:acetyltransferase-like isoleucine patch superfamily enzyme
VSSRPASSNGSSISDSILDPILDMRKLIIRILEYQAKRKLSRYPSIAIHPTAKVDFRRVRFTPGGRLEIGEGSMVEGSLVFERGGANVVIGRNTFIGGSILSCANRIEIGDDVLISWGCTISDHNSHAVQWSQRKQDVRDWYQGKKDWTHVTISPIKVGNRSWVGVNVIVLKGVEIGEGAVVAAGSVVVKNVPPWTIVAGNPAKVIRVIPVEDR